MRQDDFQGSWDTHVWWAFKIQRISFRKKLINLITMILGMQYYDSTTSTYQCFDKYHGRALDQPGLKKLFGKFMRTSGKTLRQNICVNLLERLKKLREVIRESEGLRLFGTSLLVVFEGSPNAFETVILFVFFNSELSGNRREIDRFCQCHIPGVFVESEHVQWAWRWVSPRVGYFDWLRRGVVTMKWPYAAILFTCFYDNGQWRCLGTRCLNQ